MYSSLYCPCGASFLILFSFFIEVQKEEIATGPVSVPKTLITVQQKVKKRPFFIAGDDLEIEGM